MEGSKKCESPHIEDKNGNMLREQKLILERWHRHFHNLLNLKADTVDPAAVERVPQLPSLQRVKSGGIEEIPMTTSTTKTAMY